MKMILIIEDDTKIASALSIRFQSQGYQTRVAGDAIVGFDMAVRYQPDLMLMDISLPGGNGLALAKRFRSQPQTQAIPFILITASKDPDLMQKAMELGAAGLLEKPYDAGELLELAQYALGDTSSRAAPCVDQASDTAKPSPNLAGKKILVVDDDEKIALALTVRLKAAGYETSTAHDAVAAVSAAVKLNPDLVLLDISMPAGNGFLVAERIQKAIPRAIPVIFLTASKKPELRERARHLRAAGYFEKPFEAAELMASIRQSLLN